MGREKYKLEWQTFQNHSVNLNRNLYNDTAFSDVTLMTDDFVQTPAHKVILSAASTVFKELCAVGSKGVEQILYLRGIKQEELDAMLQFIYLGEATVYEDRLKEFSRVVRDFSITKLNEFQYLQDQVTPTKKRDTAQTEKDSLKKKDEEKSKLEKKEINGKEMSKKMNTEPKAIEENSNRRESKKVKFEEEPAIQNTVSENADSIIEDPFLCLECEMVFNDKTAFDHHYQATHVKTPNQDSKQMKKKMHKKKFSCLFCSDKLEGRDELMCHLQSHDLPYYPCQICDFITDKLFKLKNHIKKIHELSMKEYSKELEDKKQPEEADNSLIENEKNTIELNLAKTFGQEYDEMDSIEETTDILQSEMAENELSFDQTSDSQMIQQKHEGTSKQTLDDFQPQKCLKCHQQFSSREAMTEHFRLVFPTEKYHCPDVNCDQKFESKNLVKFHVNDAHKDIRFKCVKCNIQFSKENILKNHIKRMHQGA